jgi:hypothetical protein
VKTTANIDYLTVSITGHQSNQILSAMDVLYEFAELLPELYRKTCKDMITGGIKTMRISQYGIAVSEQYGTAKERGWELSVQLSGEYWEAIGRDLEAVLKILSGFKDWRVSRLDLACDVCVPLEDWRKYYKGAFEAGKYVIYGKEDSRTVEYGSRKSQFFTRVYNKTAEDGEHYPAPDGYMQARYEIEIKRVTGEKVLMHAFEPVYTDSLFIQRVLLSIEHDSTGFIQKYFATADAGTKIQTVQRKIGNLESTTNYVFTNYSPYIGAAFHSELIANRYSGIEKLGEKGEKILAILDSGRQLRAGGGGSP